MSKKALTVVISGVCCLVAIILTLILYWIYYMTATGGMGSYAESYIAFLEFTLSCVIKIGLFIPMCAFLGRIRKCNRIVKYGVLVVGVIVWIVLSFWNDETYRELSYFYKYEGLLEIRWLGSDYLRHRGFNFLFSAVSAVVWASVAYGFGLLPETGGKEAPEASAQPAPYTQPNPPAGDHTATAPSSQSKQPDP